MHRQRLRAMVKEAVREGREEITISLRDMLPDLWWWAQRAVDLEVRHIPPRYRDIAEYAAYVLANDDDLRTKMRVVNAELPPDDLLRRYCAIRAASLGGTGVYGEPNPAHAPAGAEGDVGRDASGRAGVLTARWTMHRADGHDLPAVAVLYDWGVVRNEPLLWVVYPYAGSGGGED